METVKFGIKKMTDKKESVSVEQAMKMFSVGKIQFYEWLNRNGGLKSKMQKLEIHK